MPMAHPLQSILYKPETSGRLAKWAINLGEFDVQFVPRTVIKAQAQALADFMAKFLGHSQTTKMIGDTLV